MTINDIHPRKVNLGQIHASPFAPLDLATKAVEIANLKIYIVQVILSRRITVLIVIDHGERDLAPMRRAAYATSKLQLLCRP